MGDFEARTLVKLDDGDGNILEVVEVIEGTHLIAYITDENDIPVGLYLEPGNARQLRDALTQWLGEDN